MSGIVGRRNAGFKIIEAMRINPSHGYCIGRTNDQYVTWFFTETPDGKTVNFYHGHYYQIDHDAPLKSAAKLKADYCRRLMESYERISKYGY